jgi:ectoine hydroxylase-related dioxygenase (phytanoyl-CoA dioxygenase family)
MTRSKLSAEQIDAFREHGFLGPFTLCSPEAMAQARRRLDQSIDRESREETIASQVQAAGVEERPLRALYDRHLTDPAVYALAAHAEILSRAVALLGPDLLLWRTTFWIKEPFGRRLEWHQDTYKDEGFGSFPNLNAWIAIDEATVDNAVRLVPGTHRAVIERDVFCSPGYVAALRASDDLPPPPAGRGAVVTMALHPGEFFLFDGRVLHGSPPNRAAQRRAGLVTRFIPAGTSLAGLSVPSILVAGRDCQGRHVLAEPPLSAG